MCLSTNSAFADQTRQSWNPIMNLKNLTQPTVALHQAEDGLSLRPMAGQAAPSPLQDTVDFAPRKSTFGGTFLGGG